MEGFEQVVALQSTVFPPEESYSINQILELCTLETVLYDIISTSDFFDSRQYMEMILELGFGANEPRIIPG